MSLFVNPLLHIQQILRIVYNGIVQLTLWVHEPLVELGPVVADYLVCQHFAEPVRLQTFLELSPVGLVDVGVNGRAARVTSL